MELENTTVEYSHILELFDDTWDLAYLKSQDLKRCANIPIKTDFGSAFGINYTNNVEYKLDDVVKTYTEYVNGFANATTRRLEYTPPRMDHVHYLDQDLRLYMYSNTVKGLGYSTDTHYHTIKEFTSLGSSYGVTVVNNKFYIVNFVGINSIRNF